VIQINRYFTEAKIISYLCGVKISVNMHTINPTIVVLWDEVYTEVRKVTGYTGHKGATDGSGYMQLGVKESQYELLDRFRAEAIVNVQYQLRRVIKKVVEAETGIQIELQMPMNWNLGLKPSLVETIKSYVVNYIISKWLRLADNSEGVENKPEPKYAADADSLLSNVGTIINSRVRPTHPRYLHEFPSESVDGTESGSEESGSNTDSSSDSSSDSGSSSGSSSGLGPDLDEYPTPSGRPDERPVVPPKPEQE